MEARTRRPSRDPMEDIRKRLDRLRRSWRLRIDELTGQQKSDYDALFLAVNMSLTTPDYPALHREVTLRFSDLDREQIKPETVGAYFAGCLRDKNAESACSSVCAGSMPLPDESDVCDVKVVVAQKNASGVRNLRLVNQSDSDHAMLYIDDFNGITEGERNTLRNMNVKRVKVMSGGEDSDYQNLSELPRIAETYHQHSVQKVAESENSEILWIFAITGLLALLFILTLASK